MKLLVSASIAAAMIAASSSLGLAQTSTPGTTPGHEMQRNGSKAGSPGASGYSPGHEMQRNGSKTGSPGASGYAPGRQ